MVTTVVVVAVLIAVLLAFAATRPDSYRVERVTVIDAPPEKIFPLINDFHNWPAWSPWEKLDPDMKKTYSGAAEGRGAVYAWEGNKKAGAGRMEIVESSSPTRVAIKLDFLKPFEGHSITEYLLERAAASTKVTWAMRGTHTFAGKLMCVFVSMDRLVGKDFETGLANLKRTAER